jgi:hypothetical protein
VWYKSEAKWGRREVRYGRRRACLSICRLLWRCVQYGVESAARIEIGTCDQYVTNHRWWCSLLLNSVLRDIFGHLLSHFPFAPTPHKIRTASRNSWNLRVIELQFTTEMAISQQIRNGASPSTRPVVRIIRIAASVGSGRGGRIQEEAEPFDSSYAHYQVRRMGYLGSQTAPQSNGEHDLGHSCALNDDSTCPIVLEQMLQVVTAQAENLELLTRVMRSGTDEIANQLLTRLRSGASTEDLIEFIRTELSEW